MQTHQILSKDLSWFICSRGQGAYALGKRKETKGIKGSVNSSVIVLWKCYTEKSSFLHNKLNYFNCQLFLTVRVRVRVRQAVSAIHYSSSWRNKKHMLIVNKARMQQWCMCPEPSPGCRPCRGQPGRGKKWSPTRGPSPEPGPTCSRSGLPGFRIEGGGMGGRKRHNNDVKHTHTHDSLLE